MGITNLPPQAYTRETLVKAIDWINNQPPSVRERANTADLIVSHFLQARRFAAAQQEEAPVSGENFKSDLKHLANDLKQFEEPIAPPPPMGRSFTYAPVEEWAPAPMPPPPPMPPPLRYEERPAPARGVAWTVDHRSLTLARELQQRMNLSSEAEALRFLIALGGERMRQMLP